jgi:hypothetical protein
MFQGPTKPIEANVPIRVCEGQRPFNHSCDIGRRIPSKSFGVFSAVPGVFWISRRQSLQNISSFSARLINSAACGEVWWRMVALFRHACGGVACCLLGMQSPRTKVSAEFRDGARHFANCKHSAIGAKAERRELTGKVASRREWNGRKMQSAAG